MARTSNFAAVVAVIISQASAVTFTAPAQFGAAGYSYAPLDPAPVGVSFEFFAFPAYFTDVPATEQCLSNWQALTGTWPPIRIGGTTQDRALYDANMQKDVDYSVASPADAPESLTYGPSFMTLAGTYNGSVVMGLNRGKNDLENTIQAAKLAVEEVDNLLAIELGNEPDYWAGAKQPITQGIEWSPAADAASQNDWGVAVGNDLGKTNFIQAGNWNMAAKDGWGAQTLIPAQNVTARQNTATYSHHNYPGGPITVQDLMSHSNIVTNLQQFDTDVAAAASIGKPYVLGETNSVAGGGAAVVSPTFGAALWTMDYVVRAAASNISRTYYHQGTVGNCQYCMWGRSSMGAPYYGATAAVAFLAGGAHITALDTTGPATNYGAYMTFGPKGKPLRALLYNSDFYDGNGERPSTEFVLAGLDKQASGAGRSVVQFKRLTAASALSRQDQGGDPTWGGQTFANGTCEIGGTQVYEEVDVLDGQAKFSVRASEALVVYLQQKDGAPRR